MLKPYGAGLLRRNNSSIRRNIIARDDSLILEPPPSVGLDADILPSPLHEIVVMPQQGENAASYWFSGAGRALFAEEVDGRWFHIEYVFAVGQRLFELRWTEGRPARLWSMNRALRDIELDTLVSNPRQKELNFPVEEIQQMELVMQNVPHSLWARLIKLAMDAHFIEKPFPQRMRERHPERRRLSNI